MSACGFEDGKTVITTCSDYDTFGSHSNERNSRRMRLKLSVLLFAIYFPSSRQLRSARLRNDRQLEPQLAIKLP